MTKHTSSRIYLALEFIVVAIVATLIITGLCLIQTYM